MKKQVKQIQFLKVESPPSQSILASPPIGTLPTLKRKELQPPSKM